MNDYLFTFHSVTHAQKGLRALQYAGIPGAIRRTPAALAERGCGYSIAVPARYGRQANEILRGYRYSRVYRMEEQDTTAEVAW